MHEEPSDGHRFARLVQKVADPVLAAAFVAYELERRSAEASAFLLIELASSAETHDAEARRALLLASIALSAPHREALRNAIADAATGLGHPALASQLRSRLPGDAESETGPAPPVPDFGRGRPLTLGERKSLARSRNRELIARVLRDPHPDVIRILLGNPALTEADVVRLCARRPIAAAVLREVFQSPRWMSRYGVRLAMARNPHLPLELALGLVPHLRRTDARTLADDETLAPPLRDACARRFEPRVIH